MKIEIAESLIYSYLKHNEGCRFVQTNWMTSGKWIITEYEKERAQYIREKLSCKIMRFNPDAPDFSIFTVINVVLTMILETK